MRKTLMITLSSIAMLAACTPASTGTTDGSSSSSEDSSMHQMSSSSKAASAKATSSTAPTPTGAARVIEMTATDWTFSPAAITAKKGEKIIVRLHGNTGEHSFAIEELGLNVTIKPGETKDIVIPTDKTGTFTFRCRIPCGPGHKDMKGSIVIS